MSIFSSILRCSSTRPKEVGRLCGAGCGVGAPELVSSAGRVFWKMETRFFSSSGTTKLAARLPLARGGGLLAGRGGGALLGLCDDLRVRLVGGDPDLVGL